MTSDNLVLLSLGFLITIGVSGCDIFSDTSATFGGSLTGSSSSSASTPTAGTSSTTLTVPTIYVTSTSSTAIALSWTMVIGATSFTLYMDGNQIASTANTTYTDTSFTTGVQHCFTVRANSPQQSSAVSADACTTPPASSGPATGGSASNNVMQVTVNGSFCSAATTADAGYTNKPCASITICQPGTTTCQTVSDILIDTGSYGLRLFPSGTNADGSSYNLSSLSLPSVLQSGVPVANCAQFLDGSALWGPVVRADVILVSGGETASSIPIELINSSFGGEVPSSCDDGQAAATAADAGFNGIMGIGLWAQDCGADCDPAYTGSVTASGISASYYPYYTCSGNNCSQALVNIANQVTNPVSAFPVNNNGVIFELPSISSDGVTSVNGSIVLGIGTGGNSNNALGSAKVYYADANASFATAFNGVTYSDSSTSDSIMGSFIDSGSNSYLFVPPSNVNCCGMNSSGDILSSTVSCSSASSSGWVCSSYNGSATNEGVGFSTGDPISGSGAAVSFDVASFYTLGSGSSMVFSNIAAADVNASSANPSTFDFGLPFFFGRSIYVGFQRMSGNTLVSQPYWAY